MKRWSWLGFGVRSGSRTDYHVFRDPSYGNEPVDFNKQAFDRFEKWTSRPCAVRTYPAELATVEYGPPGMDGERVHTGVQDEEQGVSVSMNLCTPYADGWGAKKYLENSVFVTDLRFALTPRFLVSWFGRSNIS